jgi:hypothetical protein
MLTSGPVPTNAARFLVALRPTKDLLLWAKYLFVAANDGKLPCRAVNDEQWHRYGPEFCTGLALKYCEAA